MNKKTTTIPVVVSRQRRWAFRAVAATLIPLLVLLGLELVLRVAGTGYPSGFFVRDKVGGREIWTGNLKFGWRFFPPRLARTCGAFTFPVSREPGVQRVFILGESAAYGDPRPDYGVSRILDVLLREKPDGVRYDVINTAMIAINSHVIVPIARDCAKLSAPGDVWVVYMGNNEVVGPFGAGTVFGPQTLSLPLIRASLRLKTTRLGQYLDALSQRVRQPAGSWQSWGGLEMFLAHRLRANDPKMARVYAHFTKNLEEIVRLGTRAGVKVVLCTVAVNLKDCAPFASLHRPDLTNAQLAQWSGLFAAGTTDQHRQALQLDDQHAELLFRLARCEWSNGDYAAAAEHFSQARDADTLRFRADSHINQIIRSVADRHRTTGVYLLDAEAALVAVETQDIASLQEVPGRELFYDHVHFNFDGNYRLACGLAEQIAPSITRLSLEECQQRLGFSDWSRLGTAELLQDRLNVPPFTTQYDHAVQRDRLDKEITRLQAACTPAALAEAVALHRHALARMSEDWMLHRNLGQLLRQTGDLAGAVQEMQQVVELVPRYAEGWRDLGLCRHLRGRFAEAAEAYEQSLRRYPYDAQSHLVLGDALASLNRPTEALRHYQEAVRLQPDHPQPRLGLGLHLAHLGKDTEALAQFSEAVRLQPDNAEAQLNLGVALANQQRFSEAVPHFEAALRLRPDDETIKQYLAACRARTSK